MKVFDVSSFVVTGGIKTFTSDGVSAVNERVIMPPTMLESTTAICGLLAWKQTFETWLFGMPLRDWMTLVDSAYEVFCFAVSMDAAASNGLMLKLLVVYLFLCLQLSVILIVVAQKCSLHQVARVSDTLLVNAELQNPMYAMSKLVRHKRHQSELQRGIDCLANSEFFEYRQDEEPPLRYDASKECKGALCEVLMSYSEAHLADPEEASKVRAEVRKDLEEAMEFFNGPPSGPAKHYCPSRECCRDEGHSRQKARRHWRKMTFGRQPEEYEPARWMRKMGFLLWVARLCVCHNPMKALCEQEYYADRQAAIAQQEFVNAEGQGQADPDADRHRMWLVVGARLKKVREMFRSPIFTFTLLLIILVMKILDSLSAVAFKVSPCNLDYECAQKHKSQKKAKRARRDPPPPAAGAADPAHAPGLEDGPPKSATYKVAQAVKKVRVDLWALLEHGFDGGLLRPVALFWPYPDNTELMNTIAGNVVLQADTQMYIRFTLKAKESPLSDIESLESGVDPEACLDKFLGKADHCLEPFCCRPLKSRLEPWPRQKQLHLYTSTMHAIAWSSDPATLLVERLHTNQKLAADGQGRRSATWSRQGSQSVLQRWARLYEAFGNRNLSEAPMNERLAYEACAKSVVKRRRPNQCGQVSWAWAREQMTDAEKALKGDAYNAKYAQYVRQFGTLSDDEKAQAANRHRWGLGSKRAIKPRDPLLSSHRRAFIVCVVPSL